MAWFPRSRSCDSVIFAASCILLCHTPARANTDASAPVTHIGTHRPRSALQSAVIAPVTHIGTHTGTHTGAHTGAYTATTDTGARFPAAKAFHEGAVLEETEEIFGTSSDEVTLSRQAPTAADGAREDDPETRRLRFSELEWLRLEPALYRLTFSMTPGPSIWIPPCQVRAEVWLDGKKLPSGGRKPLMPIADETTAAKTARARFEENAGFRIDLDEPAASQPHEVTLGIQVSDYEHRIACGGKVISGTTRAAIQAPTLLPWGGLRKLSFASPNQVPGSCRTPLCTPGFATVYQPSCSAPKEGYPLLVGLHPWNGGPYTYAAYRELRKHLDERCVAMLLPSGLGNSLYVAPAENEVMLALAATRQVLTIDRERTSIFGASMGGQGATTVGFHRPDHFASVVSLFGDAKFDLRGGVRRLLPTEADALAVNPEDAAMNAKEQEVLLIHGDNDVVSPYRESTQLLLALKKAGVKSELITEKGRGHEGELVTKHAARIVELAATSTIPKAPARVTYRSVRADLRGAYGVTLEPKVPGSARIELEILPDSIMVHAIENVKRVEVTRTALAPKPITFAPNLAPIPVVVRSHHPLQ
jgi:pimeloyl-ACP methyl ester carboxylesterase